MQADDGGAPQSGPYLVCCFTSADATLLFPTFLTTILPQRFGQMKEQLPDLLLAQLLCLDTSPTGCQPRCHCSQQHLSTPIKSLIMRKHFYRRCLLVYLLFLNIFISYSANNILRWGGECAGVVFSWRWHSMLWYSNGVIHHRAPLKHLDKPAEAAPVAMVTILKVDVCSQTLAAKMINTVFILELMLHE